MAMWKIKKHMPADRCGQCCPFLPFVMPSDNAIRPKERNDTMPSLGMSNNYSPGPWIVQVCSDAYNITLQDSSTVEAPLVAIVPLKGIGCSNTAKANADLIAALPDFLNVVFHLTIILGPKEDELPGDLQALLKEARSAIGKAIGSSDM